ncbi:hypothetical protein JOM56_009367 [Amanita muscaria]
MIAIRCKDGSVVLLQLPTTATGTAARAGYDGNRSYGTPAQQTVAVALPSGQNVCVPTALVRNEVQENEGLEEAGGYTSGEESQRPSPLSYDSHRHGMYTTATPSLPSQRQESPAPAPRPPPALLPRRQEGAALVPPPIPPRRRESPAPAPPPLPPRHRESPAPAPPPIPPRRRGPLAAPAPSALNLSGDFQ